jgi:DNA end-binding protein Ku
LRQVVTTVIKRKVKMASWKGSITFGLVNIPITLVNAETLDKVHFHMLDKRDHGLIGYKMINKSNGKDVDRKNIIKGFELDENKFIEVTAEDLKKANVKATQTIEIDTFVNREEIDPRYFVKPYFVEPQKKSEKSYALLREVLRQSQKVAIATIVMNTKQHLAALMVFEDIIILEILRFGHEIKNPHEVKVPTDNLKDLGLKPAEIKMAESLVSEMSEKWNPQKYKDQYQDDVKAFIKSKIKAKKSKQAPPEMESEEDLKSSTDNVVDIMDLLKKSMSKKGKPKAKPTHQRSQA